MHIIAVLGYASRSALLRWLAAVLQFAGYDDAIKRSDGELPSERREQQTEARFAFIYSHHMISSVGTDGIATEA